MPEISISKTTTNNENNDERRDDRFEDRRNDFRDHEQTITQNFDAMRLKLASPEIMLEWSHGEVKKPETINYRTQRPEKDGLFCEKIFGPTKDWECYCGKYKRVRYKGIVCDKCGVEVTRAVVRRERMGHIQLAAPVSHIWFLRGVPSKVGLVLDLSVQELEKVIYFANYIVLEVDEEEKKIALEMINSEFKQKKKAIDQKYEKMFNDLNKDKMSSLAKTEAKAERKKIEDEADKRVVNISDSKEKEHSILKKALQIAKKELNDLKPLKIITELEFRDLSLKYGQVFEADIGAEAIRRILEKINLDDLVKQLEVELVEVTASHKRKMKRRLELVKSLIKAEIRPEWMILTTLPVIPPDLRPMVQLDGGRFAASDLNDLYRRVINRNNRLKRLNELNAPEVICRNEKRMLQEAVDALIDNSARRGKAVSATTGQKRALRSLADMLKGKQGRFRQNLLGKRVDYSGRSVIVIGPNLKLDECGIPKKMALELFKPFVIKKLIENEYAHNVRSAGKLIEEGRKEIWDMLEEVIKGHYVMLNRAPTLHRLSIQAFKPVLIEGKAIQIHPMVCSAFNADFDGDQMSVHVPLTVMAREEAENIMSSARNLLKPATGEPITTPSQDMVLGSYYITNIREDVLGAGKIYSTEDEAMMSFSNGDVHLQAKIKVRIKTDEIIESSVGRIMFNEILPKEFYYMNELMTKKKLKALLAEIIETKGVDETIEFVDNIKNLGFESVTIAGVSWGMDDLVLPEEKTDLIERGNNEVEEVRQQFKSGLLTDEERYKKIIEIWAQIKEDITKVSIDTLDKFGPVYSMVDSGARGSWPQIVQMMGIRGLMANPAGKTIELPVINSFKEGLNVLEYFISTHGARKGLSDTALRTANAGYLTRRLIDVAQDVIIYEEDCKDKDGFLMKRVDTESVNRSLGERVLGRVLAEDLKVGNKIIGKKGDYISKEMAAAVDEKEVSEILIRSVLSCKAKRGLCQKCYGWDLGYNSVAKFGQAVGIIAAQSIGEPGTQLTMRTFHTGGVASAEDITQGLPRVEELFEARGIKKPALVSDRDGLAHIEEAEDGQKVLNIVRKDVKKVEYGSIKDLQVLVKDNDAVAKGQTLARDKNEKNVNAKEPGVVKIENDKLFVVGEGETEKSYTIASDAVLWVKHGEVVAKGQQLTEGPIDLQSLFQVAGRDAVMRYILREVQYIYSSQGQDVNDKHVEVIIRQMLSRVRIKASGESTLLDGEVVDKLKFDREVKKMKDAGKVPPEADDLLLGITKASLSTSSFLSAASFQETARVLINAAITGKKDELKGLKENVIIGKLIPAGTGFEASKKKK
ncbi:MAG: DNA-directed RNA polymerase subunit beta' [bacterium]